ncbi:hypothetical protein [Listeria booriae]|uniref:hypothetical protein n=1 Tax=Listeria booriae TaxID=1552123 RepID=UPI0016240135|nr:hypothetical protein [Listeria booriae]MBC1212440.1 hypothetical protein [Listeria booriae]MBC1309314.1 hypothetical protein [Listeria booriae]
MAGKKRRKLTTKEKQIIACATILVLALSLYVYKFYIYESPVHTSKDETLIVKEGPSDGKKAASSEDTTSSDDGKKSSAEQAQEVFTNFLKVYPTFLADHPLEHIEKAKLYLEPGFYQALIDEQKNKTVVTQYKTTEVTSIESIATKQADAGAYYWKADVTTINKDANGKPLSTIVTQYVATMKEQQSGWIIIDLMQEGKSAKVHESSNQ